MVKDQLYNDVKNTLHHNEQGGTLTYFDVNMDGEDVMENGRM